MPRRLLDSEIHLLRSVFGDELDYARIRLGPTWVGRLLFPRFAAVVFGQTIHYRPSAYLADTTQGDAKKMALLVHEVCHCWQAQRCGYWWGKGMVEQLKYGKRVYQFRIEDFEELVDYRWEQQAAIVQRFYNLRAVRSPQADYYLKVIRTILPAVAATAPSSDEAYASAR